MELGILSGAQLGETGRELPVTGSDLGIDLALVRRLVATRFPQWSALPAEPVQSAGTDNAIYRLGDNMTVRLPRVG